MALKKTITLKNNFDEESIFENAYIKVESIVADKHLVNARISYNKNEPRIQLMISGFSFTPSLEGGNFIAQAYKHMKTLPEFADAVDC